MSERRNLLGEMSWFQVAAGVLAAVTAAWIASSLGVAGTLIGTAVASFVASISAALYGRTLHKGKTLLVQTASGTMIEKTVQDGEMAEAIEQAAEVDRSPVTRAEVIEKPDRRLHWKTIIATAVVLMLLALAAISTVELVSGKSLDGSHGTTIGDTFSGKSSKSSDDNKNKDDDKDEPDKAPATEKTPTPRPTATKPAPTPTATTPAPTQTTPTPAATTPTPTPEEPVE